MGIHERLLTALMVGACIPAYGVPATSSDAAARFGARPDVSNMRMSPDGKNVAYIAPLSGQGTALMVLPLVAGADPKIAMTANGDPDQIQHCDWVANDRLVCRIFWIGERPHGSTFLFKYLPYSRVIAVNVDGSNFQMLSKHDHWDTDLGGGNVIDLLPEEDGKILMTRFYLQGDSLGQHAEPAANTGLGVDRLDTRTGDSAEVLEPVGIASGYLSDGNGQVRVMQQSSPGSYNLHPSAWTYYYRAAQGGSWLTLSKYDTLDLSGFLPVAVDGTRNVAYGFKQQNGRRALFARRLDGSNVDELVFASDDFDVSGVYRIGRHQRVVGVDYVSDYEQVEYTDPDIKRLSETLRRAVGAKVDLRIVDSNVDESKLLLFSSADQNAGVYYVFDRGTHHLDSIALSRAALDGVALADVKPIQFSAKDGTLIPGYLTLPPGVTTAKGLPAIVMPHGGPSARDVWGFDWLAQYFAHQGYAVLQPNFRGSSGYGVGWFEKNGFKSWQVAIGDVLDAGRWLVTQGIADPNKLGIFGWSYGGYAALQSLVLDQGVYKAAVAVAPVTDLAAMVSDVAGSTAWVTMRNTMGTGSQTHAGSPAEHADKIKVPVLLFHGTKDLNVRYDQSVRMDRALTAAGVKHKFVTYEGLDHRLDDAEKRAELLRESDVFFKSAFGP